MTPLQSFVGIPWRVGGRSFDGIDCVGLALLAQRELWGRELSFPWDYNPERDVNLETAICQWIPHVLPACDAPVIGGVVVFEFVINKVGYKHIATIIDRNLILHIYPKHKSIITSLNAHRNRVWGYFAAREVRVCRIF